MKEWTPTLKAHKALGTTTLATCINVTRTDGFVLTTTQHDEDIEVDAVTYLASVGYSPSDVVSGSELAPDNLEIEGFLASPSITADDIRSGLWDHAAIEMFEVDFTNPAGGRDNLRAGKLGEVRAGNRQKFTAELRGLLQALSKHIGDLVTRDCRHDLGNAQCGIDLAAWTVTGAVASVTTNGEFHDTARTETTEHFTAGKVLWLTGLNEGLSMEVKRSTSSGVILLQQLMPFDIEVGDTYSMHAGCLKDFIRDCVDKFANGVNFGGAPHLPGVRIYKRGGVS
jgi:uncharacterized phage protein (TIGR02218 family)